MSQAIRNSLYVVLAVLSEVHLTQEPSSPDWLFVHVSLLPDVLSPFLIVLPQNQAEIHVLPEFHS